MAARLLLGTQCSTAALGVSQTPAGSGFRLCHKMITNKDGGFTIKNGGFNRLTDKKRGLSIKDTGSNMG
jgi:hypothetical protein